MDKPNKYFAYKCLNHPGTGTYMLWISSSEQCALGIPASVYFIHFHPSHLFGEWDWKDYYTLSQNDILNQNNTILYAFLK